MDFINHEVDLINWLLGFDLRRRINLLWVEWIGRDCLAQLFGDGVLAQLLEIGGAGDWLGDICVLVHR